MQYTGKARTAVTVLSDQVERAPAKALLRTPGAEFSRSEVDLRANDLAHRLRQVGVAEGDTVLLMLENTEHYIFSWLALSKLGAVEVPVNPAYKGQMLAHVVNTAGAKVLIADRAFLDNVKQIGNQLVELETILVPRENGEDRIDGGPRLVGLDGLEGDGSPPAVTPSYRDVMALMFTSGTTGPSKAVMITHAHAYEYANSVRMALELNEDDVYYAPLPLFHIAGQWAVVYAALMSGGTAVIKEKFSVSDFWADVTRFDASVSFLLGAMANFLYGQPQNPSDSENGLTRLLMSPLIPELSQFRSRFALEVATAYGSTECNVPIFSDTSIQDPRQCGSARAGWQVALVDEDDEVVGAGETGEIVVRPPEPWLTMKGYLGNPEATAAAYRNCWLHTGDMAYSDERGNFYFVDRLKDAIRRRGENISSFEVEREVNAHPAVLESAAVGVASEHTEEEILLVAVLGTSQALEPQELHEFLVERAPRFMVPRFIHIVDELPKTDTGKIQKSVLRERGAEQAWDAAAASAKA